MPRTARVVLAGYPHHVVQRGHDRKPVFACDKDFIRYLDDLVELKEKHRVRVFAYCLMTNHAHLLLQPGEWASSLRELIKALAGRATRYRNSLEGRTGTLWEGRYKSSLVEMERYLLACCRYIELNPVRAGIVDEASSYPWSSCRQHLGIVESRWIDADPVYLGLAASDAGRAIRYRELLGDGLRRDEQRTIQQALQRGPLTGDEPFVDEIEVILGGRIASRGPGRPRKEKIDLSPFWDVYCFRYKPMAWREHRRGAQRR